MNRGEFSGQGSGPHANVQSEMLQQLRREKIPVRLFLMNGFQMPGVITGFDAFAVILENEGRQQMIYKHAISTIAPARPVNLNGGGGRDNPCL